MGDVTVLRPQIELSKGQLTLIRNTVAADCNESEFNLFIEVARRVGLDPFRKQIYAVVYSKDNAEKRKMAIITGIDGFRAVADRSGKYRPGEEPPHIEYDPSLKSDLNTHGIVSATVTAHKYGPDGQWYKLAATAYWEECAPLKEIWGPVEVEPGKTQRRPTGKFELDKSSNWYRMPRVMIAKCAEAQVLRRGWPEDLSGVYASEEMDRAAALSASDAVAEHQKEERMKLVGGNQSIPVIWSKGDALKMEPIGRFADCVLLRAGQFETLAELSEWEEMNRVGLQQFWAHHKSDALELKKQLEKRRSELT